MRVLTGVKKARNLDIQWIYSAGRMNSHRVGGNDITARAIKNFNVIAVMILLRGWATTMKTFKVFKARGWSDLVRPFPTGRYSSKVFWLSLAGDNQRLFNLLSLWNPLGFLKLLYRFLEVSKVSLLRKPVLRLWSLWRLLKSLRGWQAWQAIESIRLLKSLGGAGGHGGVLGIYIHAYTFCGGNGCIPDSAAALKTLKGEQES